MAIDADLNTGAITDEEAKIRRAEVQRESDFFGAMDGATKFVKGDAIISIITALINLIGGAVLGIMHGQDINSVLSTYSLATVGDGLCSQIPALMISVATGMVVTRAASTDSFNADIKRQFTSQPNVMMIAGIVIAALMVIPGFPKLILLGVGAALFIFGWRLSKSKAKKEAALAAQAERETLAKMQDQPTSDNDYYRDIDNVFKLLNVEQIEMEFGYSLLHLVDEKSGGHFIDRVVMFRKQFAMDMGMVIPSVRMTDNPEINPNQYVIKIKGEEVARGEILSDHYLALDNGDVVNPVDGIDTVEPAFGIPAKWISADKKVMADVAGYTLIDPVSVMITHLSEVIKQHCSELLSRQDVKTMVDNIKQTNPTLIDDLIPGTISLGYLEKVLCLLLREGVPIRDMETILETLGDHAGALKDIDIVTEYVRQALKRTITRRFAEANSLRVITVDPEGRGYDSCKRKEIRSRKLSCDGPRPYTENRQHNKRRNRQGKGCYTEYNHTDLSDSKNIFQETDRPVHTEYNGAVLQRNRQYGADTGYRQYSDVNAARSEISGKGVFYGSAEQGAAERAS